MTSSRHERMAKELRGKSIHVIGIAGTEGAASLEFLVEQMGCTDVVAHDSSVSEAYLKAFREAHFARPWPEMKRMAEKIVRYPKVRYRFGKEYLEDIENADIIFVPQSWYLYENNRPLEKLSEKLSSFMRLYFDLFPGKIIGVTGSNGKTTTANMIFSILERANQFGFLSGKVFFAGNDRRNEQVLSKIGGMGSEDWLVLEISNRHLKVDLGRSPDISVITNITPNHLSEYKDFDEYKACKESLLRHQTEAQTAVLNLDDPESRHIAERLEKDVFPFSLMEELPRGAFVQRGVLTLRYGDTVQAVLDKSDLSIPGDHNISNALAALAAAHLTGVPAEIMAESLRDFEGVARRLERVAERNGVGFYNDLASTTPESTMAGVRSFPPGSVILILGGAGKGSDYRPLVECIEKNVLQLILLSSPLSDLVIPFLSEDYRRDSMYMASSLKEAVQKSKHVAVSGNNVLLSPAGDFGWFRGRMPDRKYFRKLVKQM